MADLYLERVRALCLALPGATESSSHGRPVFRAGKVFCVYGATTKGSKAERQVFDHSIVFLPEPEDRLALEQDPNSFLPAYWGPFGWLGWDLDADALDWQEVAEILDGSYRQVAGPKLLARLDGDRQ